MNRTYIHAPSPLVCCFIEKKFGRLGVRWLVLGPRRWGRVWNVKNAKLILYRKMNSSYLHLGVSCWYSSLKLLCLFDSHRTIIISMHSGLLMRQLGNGLVLQRVYQNLGLFAVDVAHDNHFLNFLLYFSIYIWCSVRKTHCRWSYNFC